MAIEGNFQLSQRYQNFAEHALLYQAICAALAGDRYLLTTYAASPNSWEMLLGIAREESLAPLLCWEFDRRGWPVGCPGTVRRLLEGEYYRSAGRNALLLSELGRILVRLQEAGISALVLKGAALAVCLYPDPALRPMADLDIWIPSRQLEQAIELLNGLGYCETRIELGEGLNRAVGYHVCLVNKTINQAAVELHWNLLAGDSDLRQPPQEWFWEHATPLHLAGAMGHLPVSALRLDDTANLLYLMGHLYYKHGGELSQALWMYDIHLLILKASDSIQWDMLFKKADELGWSAALERILAQVQARFGTQLPVSLSFGKNAQARPGVRPPLRQTGLPAEPKRNTWNYLSSLRWQARLRVLRFLIFPSPAHMRWRYQPKPAWLWPLFYPYRWSQMLKDTWRLLVSSLSANASRR